MILCARRTSRSREQRKKRRSRSETAKGFVYYINKKIRLCDYQTGQTHFVRNSRGAQRYGSFFFFTAFRLLVIRYPTRLLIPLPLPFAITEHNCAAKREHVCNDVRSSSIFDPLHFYYMCPV